MQHLLGNKYLPEGNLIMCAAGDATQFNRNGFKYIHNSNTGDPLRFAPQIDNFQLLL